MFDYDVKIVQENQFVDTNLSQYIANKTVLVCPGVKFIQKPTLAYFEYVDSLIDTHKLDEVIILSSREDAFFPRLVSSYFPRFTTIIDTKKKYITAMKKIKNKGMTPDELASKWVFQQILQDGVEKGFWEQPLFDHWKQMVQDKKAISTILRKDPYLAKILQKLYKNQHVRDIWSIEHMNYLFLDLDGGHLFHDIGPLFFYFRLYNNTELVCILEKIR